MQKVKSINYDVSIHNHNSKFKIIEYFLFDSYSLDDLIKFIDDSINDVLKKEIFLRDDFDCFLIVDKDDGCANYPAFFGEKNYIPYRVSFDTSANRGHAKKLRENKQKIISCMVDISYLEK